tara:strand:+ start:647 stop:877 length:231 start_codon:yes stop_codon:yes gene_type:complete
LEAPRKELVNAPLSTAPAPSTIECLSSRRSVAPRRAAPEERSRVRRRVSESPGFFERTGHAMDTYLTPPRRGQHPQ